MRLERIPNFITEAERLELIDWIEGAISDKRIDDAMDRVPNSERYVDTALRQNTRFVNKNVDYPEVAFAIRDRIMDIFEWEYVKNVDFGGDKENILIVVHHPGGDTYKHTDGSIFKHSLRCNIILKKPTAGGELYVEDQKIDPEERELHCYEVTHNEHWVTEVGGEDYRCIMLVGVDIPAGGWEDGKIKRKMG